MSKSKPRYVFTEKAYRAMGYHQCPECHEWFKPLAENQIYCCKCERQLLLDDDSQRRGTRYSRGSLMAAGEEDYEG